MKARFLVCAVVLALIGCNKASEDPRSGELKTLREQVEDLAPGLGEIMSTIQQHHAKLWYSGSAQNWDLAQYELGEIKEGLEDAAKFHPQFKAVKASLNQLIPTIMNRSVAAVDTSIQKKDAKSFASQKFTQGM